MKLIVGKWCFSPRLISSMLALMFIGLFISLGFWQLDRAEYKRTLYQGFLDRQTEEEIDLNQIIDNEEDYKSFLWRHFKTTGHFDEDIQILLDNQVIKGQPGYFVYTPFQPDNSDVYVLVNRGWVQADSDRSKLPELEKTDSVISINGVLKELPKTGLLLQKTIPEKMAGDIVRVQNIDLSELEKLLNIKLLPVIFRLEPGSKHGYVRDWQPPGSGENMHLGYAFQWFVFALTLLIIYLILNIKKIA